MDLGLADRVAVVTGGTSGIGFATARILLEEGARVVICGRDAGRLKTAQDALEPVRPGELSSAEFDDVVRDIVNFLDYISEPIKRERQQLGIRVIGFLLVFLLIAYMLKTEIWKDVK